MRVVVPLEQWGRGEGLGMGWFLANGKCCIMGFILRAFGFTDADLENKGSIADFSLRHLAAYRVSAAFYETTNYADATINYGYASKLTTSVTDTNDDPNITDVERMDTLALLLVPADVHLEFTENAHAYEQPLAS